VHEFGGGQQLRVAFEPGLEPVFDRLHVVVGGFLDRLDRGAVFGIESGCKALQVSAGSS